MNTACTKKIILTTIFHFFLINHLTYPLAMDSQVASIALDSARIPRHSAKPGSRFWKTLVRYLMFSSAVTPNLAHEVQAARSEAFRANRDHPWQGSSDNHNDFSQNSEVQRTQHGLVSLIGESRSIIDSKISPDWLVPSVQSIQGDPELGLEHNPSSSLMTAPTFSSLENNWQSFIAEPFWRGTREDYGGHQKNGIDVFRQLSLALVDRRILADYGKDLTLQDKLDQAILKINDKLSQSQDQVLEMIELRKNFVEQATESDPNKSFEEVLNTDLSKNYIKHRLEEVKNLENDWLIHNIGFWTYKNGHAMAMCIKHLDNGEYRLDILNSGEGLRHHAQKYFSERPGNLPNAYFRAHFQNFEQLQEILPKIYVLSYWTHDDSTADQIYEALAPYRLEDQPLDALIEPQKAGTCWMHVYSRSFLRWALIEEDLEDVLDEASLYEFVQFLWSYWIIRFAHEKWPDEHASLQERREHLFYIEEARRHMSMKLSEWSERDVLTPEDLRWIEQSLLMVAEKCAAEKTMIEAFSPKKLTANINASTSWPIPENLTLSDSPLSFRKHSSAVDIQVYVSQEQSPLRRLADQVSNQVSNTRNKRENKQRNMAMIYDIEQFFINGINLGQNPPNDPQYFKDIDELLMFYHFQLSLSYLSSSFAVKRLVILLKGVALLDEWLRLHAPWRKLYQEYYLVISPFYSDEPFWENYQRYFSEDPYVATEIHKLNEYFANIQKNSKKALFGRFPFKTHGMKMEDLPHAYKSFSEMSFLKKYQEYWSEDLKTSFLSKGAPSDEHFGKVLGVLSEARSEYLPDNYWILRKYVYLVQINLEKLNDYLGKMWEKSYSRSLRFTASIDDVGKIWDFDPRRNLPLKALEDLSFPYRPYNSRDIENELASQQGLSLHDKRLRQVRINRQTQISSLLAYWKEHITELKKKEVIDVVFQTMMEAGGTYFLKYLQDFPNQAREFLGIFEKSFEVYALIPAQQSAIANLLRLLLMFERFLGFTQDQNSLPVYEQTLRDIYGLKTKLINHYSPLAKHNDHALFFKTLLNFSQEYLPQEELSQMLKDYAQIKYLNPNQLQDQLYFEYYKHLPEIGQFVKELPDDDRGELLDELIILMGYPQKRLMDARANNNWQAMRIKDDDYKQSIFNYHLGDQLTFDLKNCYSLENDLEQHSNQTYLNRPYIKNIFGDRIKDFEFIELRQVLPQYTLYVFFREGQDEYGISTSIKNPKIIKKHGEGWLTYLNGFPEGLEFLNLPKHKAEYLLDAGNPDQSLIYIQFKDPNHANLKVFIDKVQKTISVYKLGDDGQEIAVLVNLEQWAQVPENLLSHKDCCPTMVWANLNEQDRGETISLQSIENYPLYRLIAQAQNEQSMKPNPFHWQEQNRFALAENQSLPVYEDRFPLYQIFVDEQGQEWLWLANLPSASEYVDDFFVKSERFANQASHFPQYFLYRLSEDRLEMDSDSPEARAHLMTIFWQIRDYRKALGYLSSLKQNIELNEDVRKALLFGLSLDQSPVSMGLKVYALYLYFYSLRMSSTEQREKFDFHRAYDIYRNYLEDIAWVPEDIQNHLKEAEEELIKQFLKEASFASLSENLLYDRLSQLTKSKEPSEWTAFIEQTPLSFLSEWMPLFVLDDDITRYRKLDPGLTEDECRELDQILEDKLWKQRERMDLPLEYSQDHSKFRLLLAFEVSEGIAIREEQMQFINKLMESEQNFINLPTGAGKSTVIAPLISLLLPKTMMMMPASLFEQTYRLVHDKLQYSGRELYAMTLTRESDFDLKSLDMYISDLQQLDRQAGILIMSFDTWQTLKLKLVEESLKLDAYEQNHNGDLEEDERYKNLKEIVSRWQVLLDLIETRTKVMDEYDEALHPTNSELNFTMGASKALSEDYWKAASEILKRLFYDARVLNELLALPQGIISLRENQGRLASLLLLKEELYSEQVKPVILKYLWEDWPEETKTHFLSYLNLDQDPYNSAARSWFEKLSKENKEMATQFAFYRYILNEILPYVLSRTYLTDYGWYHKDFQYSMSRQLSVPYKRQNQIVSEFTQFEDPVVIVMFSLLSLVHEGLNSMQVDELLNAFQKEHWQQLPMTEFGQDTAAQVQFKQLFQYELTTLDRSNPKHIESLQVRSMNSYEILENYAMRFMVNQLRSHEHKIAIHFPEYLSYDARGFSATPPHTTPWAIHEFRNKETKHLFKDLIEFTGDTKLEFLSDDIGEGLMSDLLLENFFEKLDTQNFRALIDGGALIELSSYDFVHKMLEHPLFPQKALGVQFICDITREDLHLKKGQKVFWKKGEPVPIDLAKANLSPKDMRLTFFAHADTTGTDLAEGNPSLVTLANVLSMRDPEQSVGRNRPLIAMFRKLWEKFDMSQAEQKFAFIMPEEFRVPIAMVSKGNPGSLTHRDLYLWMVEKTRLVEQMERMNSHHLQLYAWAYRNAWKMILKTPLNKVADIELKRQLIKILQVDLETDPLVLYGLPRMAPSLEELAKQIQNEFSLLLTDNDVEQMNGFLKHIDTSQDQFRQASGASFSRQVRVSTETQAVEEKKEQSHVFSQSLQYKDIETLEEIPWDPSELTDPQFLESDFLKNLKNIYPHLNLRRIYATENFLKVLDLKDPYLASNPAKIGEFILEHTQSSEPHYVLISREEAAKVQGFLLENSQYTKNWSLRHISQFDRPLLGKNREHWNYLEDRSLLKLFFAEVAFSSEEVGFIDSWLASLPLRETWKGYLVERWSARAESRDPRSGGLNILWNSSQYLRSSS